MNNLSRLIAAALGLAVLVLVGFQLFFELVPPANIGVKQILWGGGGIVAEDYEPGFHKGITGYHKWHFLDRRTHFLTFAESNEGVRTDSARPALMVRTRDANKAFLDVSVTYQIKLGEAHLIVSEGLKDGYRGLVASTVDDVLREELAQLTPEDFVDTETRVKRANDTLPLLRDKLAKYHVEPERILIRAARFPDQYEEKLQEKQLTRQRALLAPAKEKVENQLLITGSYEKETEALTKEARAEWEKRLQDVRSDNQVAIARIAAEAEVYDRTTRSNADATYLGNVATGELALEQAEALRAELRNQALDTVGGRIFLATQAAENLRFDHVTLNSNDPNVPTILDLEQMVRMLVGTSEATTTD